MAIDTSLLIDPTKFDQIDYVGNQHHVLETAQNTAIKALVAVAEGTVSGGTFRMLEGKAYFKNPTGGATPWHELVPALNEDGRLVFDISETGVA